MLGPQPYDARLGEPFWLMTQGVLQCVSLFLYGFYMFLHVFSSDSSAETVGLRVQWRISCLSMGGNESDAWPRPLPCPAALEATSKRFPPAI